MSTGDIDNMNDAQFAAYCKSLSNTGILNVVGFHISLSRGVDYFFNGISISGNSSINDLGYSRLLLTNTEGKLKIKKNGQPVGITIGSIAIDINTALFKYNNETMDGQYFEFTDSDDKIANNIYRFLTNYSRNEWSLVEYQYSSESFYNYRISTSKSQSIEAVAISYGEQHGELKAQNIIRLSLWKHTHNHPGPYGEQLSSPADDVAQIHVRKLFMQFNSSATPKFYIR